MGCQDCSWGSQHLLASPLLLVPLPLLPLPLLLLLHVTQVMRLLLLLRKRLQ